MRRISPSWPSAAWRWKPPFDAEGSAALVEAQRTQHCTALHCHTPTKMDTCEIRRECCMAWWVSSDSLLPVLRHCTCHSGCGGACTAPPLLPSELTSCGVTSMNQQSTPLQPSQTPLSQPHPLPIIAWSLHSIHIQRKAQHHQHGDTRAGANRQRQSHSQRAHSSSRDTELEGRR